MLVSWLLEQIGIVGNVTFIPANNRFCELCFQLFLVCARLTMSGIAISLTPSVV
jgi:hypothetical protein